MKKRKTIVGCLSSWEGKPYMAPTTKFVGMGADDEFCTSVINDGDAGDVDFGDGGSVTEDNGAKYETYKVWED